MKIIIPMSGPDINMAEAFISCLEKFGGLKPYELVISPSEAVMRSAESLLPRLQALCKRVSILRSGYQDLGRWPHGPNSHWAKTAMALDASGNKDSWFWMEMDCVPVVEGWASRIMEEHAIGNKRFTGKIVPVPLKDGGYSNNDKMMMGCAVYCPALTESWEFRPILESMLVGVHTSAGFKMEDADPWDLMARGSFKKWGWHHTDLIGDRWNTVNYRIEDGVVVCDAGQTRFKGRAHNTTDISQAVVVHGCKDMSLHNLVLSGEFQEVHNKVREEVEEQEKLHSAGYSKDPLEIIMGRHVSVDEKKSIRTFFEGLLSEPKHSMEPVTVFASTSKSTNSSQEPATSQFEQEMEMVRKLTSGSTPTPSTGDVVAKIDAIIASGNIRLGALATQLGMDKESLKTLLQDNGFIIGGVSQWVKKAA